MTRFLTALCVLISTLNVSGQQKRQYAKSINIEVLKAIAWMADNSLYIAPEMSFYSKNWLFEARFGWTAIKDHVYRELDYENRGWFTSVNAVYKILPIKESEDGISGIYTGIGIGVSDYEEEGEILFPGDYFNDFEATLKQKNTSFFFQWNAQLKADISRKWILGGGLHLSIILNEYNQPEFPVYYVPGSGIVNIFGNRGDNEIATAGMTITVGYKII